MLSCLWAELLGRQVAVQRAIVVVDDPARWKHTSKGRLAIEAKHFVTGCSVGEDHSRVVLSELVNCDGPVASLCDHVSSPAMKALTAADEDIAEELASFVSQHHRKVVLNLLHCLVVWGDTRPN